MAARPDSTVLNGGPVAVTVARYRSARADLTVTAPPRELALPAREVVLHGSSGVRDTIR